MSGLLLGIFLRKIIFSISTFLAAKKLQKTAAGDKLLVESILGLRNLRCFTAVKPQIFNVRLVALF